MVGTEVDALILEHSLIQAHKPRFNVRLKDDKSYPWLAVTVDEEWPRPIVFRGRKRKGVRYFGPYGHVGRAARDPRPAPAELPASGPARTRSSSGTPRLGRPCLLYDIERCSGPCVGAVDHERYGQMVEDLMRFLSGDTAPVVRPPARPRWREAADALEFERAARLRDRLAAVRKAAETQQMVSEQPEDLDVIGIAEDELEAAVQVFHVRRGRVVGRSGFVADKVEDLTGRAVHGPGARAALRRPGRRGAAAGAGAGTSPSRRRVVTAWLAGLRGGPVRPGSAPAGRRSGPCRRR